MRHWIKRVLQLLQFSSSPASRKYDAFELALTINLYLTVSFSSLSTPPGRYVIFV